MNKPLVIVVAALVLLATSCVNSPAPVSNPKDLNITFIGQVTAVTNKIDTAPRYGCDGQKLKHPKLTGVHQVVQTIPYCVDTIVKGETLAKMGYTPAGIEQQSTPSWTFPHLNGLMDWIGCIAMAALLLFILWWLLILLPFLFIKKLMKKNKKAKNNQPVAQQYAAPKEDSLVELARNISARGGNININVEAPVKGKEEAAK